jgi:hypothetical protein
LISALPTKHQPVLAHHEFRPILNPWLLYSLHRDQVDWFMAAANFDRITCDAAILGGKPCMGGTRLSVDFILEPPASNGSRPGARGA